MLKVSLLSLHLALGAVVAASLALAATSARAQDKQVAAENPAQRGTVESFSWGCDWP